jgi:hypothetical protein
MRSKFIPALLLLAAAALTPARADTRLGDGCDLAILGARDRAEFLRFDSALNAALEKQDAAALALLVRFPLRVNQADGSRVSLDNAAALQSHFAQAFGPAVRAAVARQKPESLFCKADGGVMYGDGEVWADRVDVGRGQQFRVTTVNVPAGAAAAKAPAATEPKPLLACSTDKFHVVIDGREDTAPRYRSWNKPHAPPDAPALELVGKAGGEGTGSCFHRIWRFRSGNVDYVLSEPGCGPDTPKGARAELEVLIGGQSRLQSWCF